MSRSTIRKRLREKKIAVHRAKLTAQNLRDRLQFACDHIDWTIKQWRTVLVSAETRIWLYYNDRGRRVYRRRGERFAQACVKETVEYEGGSCMFWGGM